MNVARFALPHQLATLGKLDKAKRLSLIRAYFTLLMVSELSHQALWQKWLLRRDGVLRHQDFEFHHNGPRYLQVQ